MKQHDKFQYQKCRHKLSLMDSYLKLHYYQNQVNNIALYTLDSILSRHQISNKQQINYYYSVKFSLSQQFLGKYYQMDQIYDCIKSTILKEAATLQKKNKYRLLYETNQDLKNYQNLFTITPPKTLQCNPNNPEKFLQLNCQRNTCGTEESNKNKKNDFNLLNLLEDMSLNPSSSIVIRNILSDLSRMIEQLNFNKKQMHTNEMKNKQKLIDKQQEEINFDEYLISNIGSHNKILLRKQEDYGLGKIKKSRTKKKKSIKIGTQNKKNQKEIYRSQLLKSQMKCSKAKSRIQPKTPQPYYRLYQIYPKNIYELQNLDNTHCSLKPSKRKQCKKFQNKSKQKKNKNTKNKSKKKNSSNSLSKPKKKILIKSRDPCTEKTRNS